MCRLTEGDTGEEVGGSLVGGLVSQGQERPCLITMEVQPLCGQAESQPVRQPGVGPSLGLGFESERDLAGLGGLWAASLGGGAVPGRKGLPVVCLGRSPSGSRRVL
ncbi:hypothetical protein Pmani_031180 [Petrolisthes manimaculis]|uniref:Uncharacterized protein n=1 Tax=Petrolisthes manimaculis TaxID=1843537 RepID=A0AAE1NVU2_9EUCA|nr:hypothetical protein Pmani_031180 [Petrolisthes manimaculis]